MEIDGWDSKLLNWFCKLFHQNLIFHILFHHYFQIGQTHPESPNNTPHIPVLEAILLNASCPF